MIRVLIVEDSDSDTRQLISILKARGIHRIEVVSQPHFALEKLRQVVGDPSTRPDLLILDLALGIDSGYDVLRFWKSNPELMPMKVIVWTGVGGKVDEEICMHFRVNSFVKKQQGPLALQLAISPVLESRAAH